MSDMLPLPCIMNGSFIFSFSCKYPFLLCGSWLISAYSTAVYNMHLLINIPVLAWQPVKSAVITQSTGTSSPITTINL